MNIRAPFAVSPRLADILTPKTNSFGVLRFAMATLVLISHSYLYSAGTSDVEPLQSWLGRSLGECAVQVFFILSGVMVAVTVAVAVMVAVVVHGRAQGLGGRVESSASYAASMRGSMPIRPGCT